MNFKKTLTLILIIITIFSCVNIASAGWFDSQDETPEEKTITVNMTDASIYAEETILEEAGNRFAIDSSGSMVADSNTKVDVDIIYYISCDISSLSDDEKKSLDDFNGSINIMEISFEGTNGTLDVYDAELTIDGDTLIINGTDTKTDVFSGQYRFDGSTITGCECSKENLKLIVE